MSKKWTMTRKLGEEISIGDATLRFIEFRGSRVAFSIEAPDDLPIGTRAASRDERRNLGATWPPPVTGDAAT